MEIEFSFPAPTGTATVICISLAEAEALLYAARKNHLSPPRVHVPNESDRMLAWQALSGYKDWLLGPERAAHRTREIVQRRNEGQTWRQIAAGFGISRQRAQQIFVRSTTGPALKRGRPRKPIDLRRVRQLLCSGTTMARVAAALGICRNTLRNRLKEQQS